MSVHVSHARRDQEPAVIALILAAMDTYQQWCPGWRAPANVANRERARWRAEDHTARWLVAHHKQSITGIARWAMSEPAVLSLLMVDPRNWRVGVGSALHDHALGEMNEGRLRRVRLTVPEANLRARRFYERHGWCQSDAAPEHHRWLNLPMLEYTRQV